MSDTKTTYTCSFCGKTITDTTKMVAQGTHGTFICSDCVKSLYDSFEAADTEIEKINKEKAMLSTKKRLPSPSEIKKHLDLYIEGQDYAKKVLSVAVYNHYKMLRLKKKGVKDDGVELEKSNVMLIGPSGCGKTALLRALSKYLNVPFTMADITSYSSAG